MQEIQVGSLAFCFPDDWIVERFDEWAFYRHQLSRLKIGIKAVDLVALQRAGGNQQGTLWLIEVKDYRQYPRTKQIELAQEIAGKALDTVAGILPAAIRATNGSEQPSASAFRKCSELRVVLHLEPPPIHSPLFSPKLNLANVQQELKRYVKSLDPHPRVVDQANMAGLPWTVKSSQP